MVFFFFSNHTEKPRRMKLLLWPRERYNGAIHQGMLVLRWRNWLSATTRDSRRFKSKKTRSALIETVYNSSGTAVWSRSCIVRVLIDNCIPFVLFFFILFFFFFFVLFQSCCFYLSPLKSFILFFYSIKLLVFRFCVTKGSISGVLACFVT